MFGVYTGLILFLFCCFALCISPIVKKYTIAKYFLFKGNRMIFAIFSNTGSICSLSIFFVGSVSAGYFCGYIGSISILISGVVVGWIFSKAINAEPFSNFFVNENEDDKNAIYCSFEVVYNTLNVRVSRIYFLLILVIVSFLLLIELLLLKDIFSIITPQASTITFFFPMLIVAICYMYVSIGGFGAVLKTDVLQLFFLIISLYFVLGHIDLNKLPILRINVTNIIPADRSIFKTILSVFGFAALFISYFLTSEDFWIRNAGTIRDKRQSSKTVWISVLLACSIAIPGSIIGANLRIITGGQYFEYIVAYRFLLESFLEHATYFDKAMLVLFVSSISITTVDTMIITYTQMYFSISKVKKPLEEVSDPRVIMVATLAFVGLVASFINAVLYKAQVYQKV